MGRRFACFSWFKKLDTPGNVGDENENRRWWSRWSLSRVLQTPGVFTLFTIERLMLLVLSLWLMSTTPILSTVNLMWLELYLAAQSWVRRLNRHAAIRSDWGLSDKKSRIQLHGPSSLSFAVSFCGMMVFSAELLMNRFLTLESLLSWSYR